MPPPILDPIGAGSAGSSKSGGGKADAGGGAGGGRVSIDDLVDGMVLQGCVFKRAVYSPIFRQKSTISHQKSPTFHQ